MATSELLKVAYASAPADALILRSFRIHGDGTTPLNLVHDFVEHTLGGVLHEPCQISYKLPDKDASGQQKINFAIALVDSRAQKIIQTAIEADSVVYLTYTEYLEADKATPARTPITMVIVGGECSALSVQVEAQYFDMLNFAWPRERYTVDKAPGTKYL